MIIRNLKIIINSIVKILMMIYYFNKLCKNLQEKFNDIYIITTKKTTLFLQALTNLAASFTGTLVCRGSSAGRAMRANRQRSGASVAVTRLNEPMTRRQMEGCLLDTIQSFLYIPVITDFCKFDSAREAQPPTHLVTASTNGIIPFLDTLLPEIFV